MGARVRAALAADSYAAAKKQRAAAKAAEELGVGDWQRGIFL
jgi:hypothetical protein